MRKHLHKDKILHMSQAQLVKKTFFKDIKRTPPKPPHFSHKSRRTSCFVAMDFSLLDEKFSILLQEAHNLQFTSQLCSLLEQTCVSLWTKIQSRFQKLFYLIRCTYELGCLENGAAQVLKNINCSVSSCSLFLPGLCCIFCLLSDTMGYLPYPSPSSQASFISVNI